MLVNVDASNVLLSRINELQAPCTLIFAKHGEDNALSVRRVDYIHENPSEEIAFDVTTHLSALVGNKQRLLMHQKNFVTDLEKENERKAHSGIAVQNLRVSALKKFDGPAGMEGVAPGWVLLQATDFDVDVKAKELNFDGVDIFKRIVDSELNDDSAGTKNGKLLALNSAGKSASGNSLNQNSNNQVELAKFPTGGLYDGKEDEKSKGGKNAVAVKDIDKKDKKDDSLLPSKTPILLVFVKNNAHLFKLLDENTKISLKDPETLALIGRKSDSKNSKLKNGKSEIISKDIKLL